MQPLTEEQISTLMQAVEDGERIVAHCVPSRAFRVTTKDEVTFHVQQLSRQHGDIWVTLSTHTDNVGKPWVSFPSALENANEAQRQFLLEMRKIKVERNRLARELEATGKLIA